MRLNLDELRSAVRAKGLRATPSRLAVLELLRGSDAPMSHGDVADRLATQAWDRATIYVVPPLIWIIMLLWSKPWLDRYRYGPLEWLWRSLARLKPQSMKKSANAEAPAV